MQNNQYFIDGNFVSCTVFNESGLAFYASVAAKDNDIPSAMNEALEQAKKSRSEYKTEDS